MNSNLKQFILHRIIGHKCYNGNMYDGLIISVKDFKDLYEYEYQKSLIISEIKDAIMVMCIEELIISSYKLILNSDNKNSRICIDSK